MRWTWIAVGAVLVGAAGAIIWYDRKRDAERPMSSNPPPSEVKVKAPHGIKF